MIFFRDMYHPVGRNESCWPKWPENINWPSGSIFVLFDWLDRKYTGHGPAGTYFEILFKPVHSLIFYPGNLSGPS
jgi:hypothetical protein